MQIEVYARGLKVLSRRERRGFDAPFMVLGWFFRRMDGVLVDGAAVS
ncbi:MAG: hypothetical protein KatS3mg021_2812 [Fimbriimonadales bacterium]|nr:MAG: hypothetical protein KatS3mg021_2812 [Fimbriimonadales bacterium]